MKAPKCRLCGESHWSVCESVRALMEKTTQCDTKSKKSKKLKVKQK